MIPLFLGIVGYVCLVMISYAATVNNSKIITIFGSLAKQYLVDIKTLPNFAIALSVFTFVLKIKERNNMIIIKLARTTFPIYIFHQVPAFYSILWDKIYDG